MLVSLRIKLRSRTSVERRQCDGAILSRFSRHLQNFNSSSGSKQIFTLALARLEKSARMIVCFLSSSHTQFAEELVSNANSLFLSSWQVDSHFNWRHWMVDCAQQGLRFGRDSSDSEVAR